MGYYAVSIEGDFLLVSEKQKAAAKAICERFPGHDESEELVDLLYELGFVSSFNKDGDIDELFFEHQKWYYDEVVKLFDAIAPYVERGSYVAFQGEDGCLWAHYFDGSTVEEYDGIIIFPGMLHDGPQKPKKERSK